VQLRIDQFAHLLHQFPNFPLSPGAEALIRNVDQFPEIAGQIQRSGTGVGEDIPGILVGNITGLVVRVEPFDSFHIIHEIISIDGLRDYTLEPILGTLPLTTLSKATMAM
jgi:hypothetical protein